MFKCRGGNIYIFEMHLLNEEQEPSFLKIQNAPSAHPSRPSIHQHALHHYLHGETFFIYVHTWIGDIYTPREPCVVKKCKLWFNCLCLDLVILPSVNPPIQFNDAPSSWLLVHLSFVPQSVSSIYFSYMRVLYLQQKYEPFYTIYIQKL